MVEMNTGIWLTNEIWGTTNSYCVNITKWARGNTILPENVVVLVSLPEMAEVSAPEARVSEEYAQTMLQIRNLRAENGRLGMMLSGISTGVAFPMYSDFAPKIPEYNGEDYVIAIDRNNVDLNNIPELLALIGHECGHVMNGDMEDGAAIGRFIMREIQADWRSSAHGHADAMGVRLRRYVREAFADGTYSRREMVARLVVNTLHRFIIRVLGA